MSWFSVWDGLKNKTCRYLLQRYLGQFLKEPLNLEQLKVDLYNGKATLNNVSLKVEALNELFESQGWAVEVINGHVGVLMVTVPWNALMTNDSSIEISDFHLTLRPIKRQNDGTSMLESMWSSFSSSIQLAEECMKQNDDPIDNPLEAQANSILGLEKFAETIDNVLNRINAKLSNTVIRLEHPLAADKGIAIIIEVQDFNYKNETGCESHVNISLSHGATMPNAGEHATGREDKTYLLPTFAKHQMVFNGIRVYTEEFSSSQASSVTSDGGCTGASTPHDDSSLKCAAAERRIPIVEIREQQRVVMRIKQSEEINGPKVSLDVELGGTYTFLSPRQIHLLSALWNAFNEEESTVVARAKVARTDSAENDYLMRNARAPKSYMSGILTNRGNWTDDFDEPTSIIKEHLCIDSFSKEPYNSSDIYEYCESVTSSISSSSTVTGSSKFQRKVANLDSSGDILNFNIRLAAFTGLILHEDVMMESAETDRGSMLDSAEKFFACTKQNTSLEAANCCERNHLLLRVSPLIVDGLQQRNKSILLLKFSAAATKFEFCEVLEERATPLIVFDRSEVCPDGYYRRSELSLAFKSTFTCNSKEHSRTSMDIRLEKCAVELDVSIYDRLSGLLSASPFRSHNLNSRRKTAQASGHKGRDGNKKSLTEFNIVSKEAGIKLRFPIVDKRPIDDANRIPWWRQNIRTDFLLLLFEHLSFKINTQCLDLTSDAISIFYCERNIDSRVDILKVSSCKDDKRAAIDNPKITISFNQNVDEEGNIDMEPTAQGSNLPFSSEQECRQSDTSHMKHGSETILLPGETKELHAFYATTMKSSALQITINLPVIDVVLESKQLYEIIYNRLNSDLFMWEPCSPSFKNECGMSAPAPKPQHDDFFNVNLADSMYVPSTASRDGSNAYYERDFCTSTFGSSTDESFISSNKESLFADSSSSIYFSAYKANKFKTAQSKPKMKPHDCSVDINVHKGSLAIFVPVRDKENRVMPEQLGKFDVKVSKFKLFLVNGYKGSRNNCYVCFQLSDVEIYHCGLVPVNCVGESALGDPVIPKYMKSTFYKVPLGLTKGRAAKHAKREMVSLVIEMKKLPDQRIKRLRLTTVIQMATLRYNPAIASHIWLNQLIDFFDVVDYPIQGYQPFGVVTEIQLNLWNCAIDYRPRNLLYRAVVEISNFTMTSNIVSSITSCNLRFIADECVLSIAPFDNINNDYPDNEITHIPATNLVPVLDVGLFDISIRLNETVMDKCPKFDFRCSIHNVHLRTCCDSGSALARLIGHIANDEDMMNKDSETSSASDFSCSDSCDVDLLSSKNQNAYTEMLKKQQEHVNQMMAEAVKETVTASNTCYNKTSQPQVKDCGFEIFYFPDENKKTPVDASDAKDIETRNEICDILNFESNVMLASRLGRVDMEDQDPLPEIKEELGGTHSLEYGVPITGEDDYYVIADEDRHLVSNCGLKTLELSEEPLRIVDNHFYLPTEKTDLLKAPDNFPMAVMRYTLCEMTLTWHLYGGKDFPDVPKDDDQSIKTEKIQMSDAYKYGVSYSKRPQTVQFGKKTKEKITWKTVGGSNRNHEVLVEMQFFKVRFSHEVYPTYTSQATRQVLLIGDFEIRDRLQSSDIKKFLYHPKPKALSSAQTNQNAVIIKALHIRPNPQLSTAQECSLRVSLLPLRLHIDQDTLVFLVDYFTNLGDNCSNDGEAVPAVIPTTQPDQAPFMSVDDLPESLQDYHARKLVTTNMQLLMEGEKLKEVETPAPSLPVPLADETSPVFFREVIFSPEVKICFDYHGRRVELSRGPVAGLLMGLGQLQCSEIRLRKLIYRRGLLGWEKLFTYLCKEWLKDIKRNQLPKILSGVGPTYAFVQLFQGIYDLFWLPIEQYQKDGRIIRGLQLGAQSFTARTALAALEITARIIQLLQFTAETTFDMVSPGPSVRRWRRLQKGKKKRPHRPKDIREGVTNAYLIVKEGINDSANTLIETAVAEHDQKGYTGAVGAVMRQIPQLVVCPAVLATQATTNILGGVKNSLVPEAKMEAREKWKDDTD